MTEPVGRSEDRPHRARPATQEEIKAMGGCHEIIVSEPVSFAYDGERVHLKGTREYDRLLREARKEQ